MRDLRRGLAGGGDAPARRVGEKGEPLFNLVLSKENGAPYLLVPPGHTLGHTGASGQLTAGDSHAGGPVVRATAPGGIGYWVLGGERALGHEAWTRGGLK